MNYEERRFGLVAIGFELLSFLWFLILHVLGIFTANLTPVEVHAVRLVLYILLAGFLVGLAGVFLDRRKFLSGLAMVALIPVLTIMGMINGHW